MTCRLSESNWLNVLYSAVRETEGGVTGAAAYVSEKRGKRIHPESLRAKLNSPDEDPISVEMASLVTDWMGKRIPGVDHSKDWLHALCAQHGMVCAPADQADDGPVDPQSLMLKGLLVGEGSGVLMRLLKDALADSRVCQNDRNYLVRQIRIGVRVLQKFEAMVNRAAEPKAQS